MSKLTLQQDIPKRKSTCFSGEESFEAGMAYTSSLEEDEAGKWVRRDFCLPCWDAWKVNHAYRPESTWRSKVQKEKKVPVLDRSEKIMELLREALQKTSLEDSQEAFILALYLARQKKIFLRSQDERWMIYEHMDTEEMLLIPRLELASLQIEKIQTALAGKL